MSNISVRNLSITNRSTMGVTSITESFTGPAGGLPFAWCQGGISDTPITNPNYVTQYAIAAAPDVINGLAISSFGNGVVSHLTFGYCVPGTLLTAVYGKTQFIQGTLVGNTTPNSAQFGIGCCIRPGSFINGYILISNPANPTCALQRFSPNAQNQAGSSLNQATIVGPVNANLTPIGTVIRVSVDFAVPAAPVITVKFNGAQVAQFTDNVAPLSGGIPGFMSACGSAGGAFFFRNVTAGLGL